MSIQVRRRDTSAIEEGNAWLRGHASKRRRIESDNDEPNAEVAAKPKTRPRRPAETVVLRAATHAQVLEIANIMADARGLEVPHGTDVLAARYTLRYFGYEAPAYGNDAYDPLSKLTDPDKHKHNDIFAQATAYIMSNNDGLAIVIVIDASTCETTRAAINAGIPAHLIWVINFTDDKLEIAAFEAMRDQYGFKLFLGTKFRDFLESSEVGNLRVAGVYYDICATLLGSEKTCKPMYDLTLLIERYVTRTRPQEKCIVACTLNGRHANGSESHWTSLSFCAWLHRTARAHNCMVRCLDMYEHYNHELSFYIFEFWQRPKIADAACAAHDAKVAALIAETKQRFPIVKVDKSVWLR